MGAARSSLIVALSLAVLVALLLGIPSPSPRGRFEYAGLVVAPTLVGERNVKDPEFFRYPDHSLFRDSDGRYYVVVTADRYPAILTTKDLFHYELFAKLNLSGKVAPFVLYDPQGKDFYLFYSDWGNTISSDVEYARLGLAIAHSERGAVPKLFTDLGYVTVDGSPLIDPSADWDPYVVMIGGHYFMIFSAASHGVHLATADGIGTAGLATESDDAGPWARFVVEKPFGRDLDSARQLNQVLHQTFQEDNIFRIDHYLGKEAVQNLLYFRFCLSLLNPIFRFPGFFRIF